MVAVSACGEPKTASTESLLSPREADSALYQCLEEAGIPLLRDQQGRVGWSADSQEEAATFDNLVETCEARISQFLPQPDNAAHMKAEQGRLNLVAECIKSHGFDAPEVPSVETLSADWKQFGASSWDGLQNVPPHSYVNVSDSCLLIDYP